MIFRELRTDREIQDAFPLMSTLRDRIRADTFLAEVQRQQRDGYQLMAGSTATASSFWPACVEPIRSRAGSIYSWTIS